MVWVSEAFCPWDEKGPDDIEVVQFDAIDPRVGSVGCKCVRRIEIDPEQVFPDVDRTNNRWSRQP